MNTRARRLRRQRRKWGKPCGDCSSIMIRYIYPTWVCRKNGEVRQRRVELLGYNRNRASEWKNNVQAWAVVPWKPKSAARARVGSA